MYPSQLECSLQNIYDTYSFTIQTDDQQIMPRQTCCYGRIFVVLPLDNNDLSHAKDLRILRIHLLLFLQRAQPIHVHVMKNGYQTVFELILMDGELQEIRTRSEAGYPLLNEKDKATAEEFIRAYYKNIVEKWMNFFVLKKRVRCTQITKKVK